MQPLLHTEWRGLCLFCKLASLNYFIYINYYAMFEVKNQLWVKNRLTTEILDLTFSENLWNGLGCHKNFLFWASNKPSSGDSDLLLPPSKPTELTWNDQLIYQHHTAKECDGSSPPASSPFACPYTTRPDSMAEAWFYTPVWEVDPKRLGLPFLLFMRDPYHLKKLERMVAPWTVSKRWYHPQIVDLRKYHLVYAALGSLSNFLMNVVIVFMTMMVLMYVKMHQTIYFEWMGCTLCLKYIFKKL